MVNQKEALDRLNKEKDYEDKLASDLLNYYLVSIDKIFELTSTQRNKVRESLNRIAHDSQGHSDAFNMLINYVLNNGETEY
jgi:hypothetical protein